MRTCYMRKGEKGDWWSSMMGLWYNTCSSGKPFCRPGVFIYTYIYT